MLRDTHTSLVQVEGMLATALADMETGYARPGSDVRPLLPVKTTPLRNANGVSYLIVFPIGAAMCLEQYGLLVQFWP